MLMVNQLVGFGAFSSGPAEALISRLAGTAIGNLAAGGGLAAAFNGGVEAFGVSAALAGTAGYCGKDWGGGVTKIASKVVVYGSTDNGFSSAGGTDTTTLTFYASNSLPATPTDGTSIGTTGSFADANSDIRTIVSTDLTTAWRYMWVHINSVANICISEIEFYELV